jgi:hypothetical protein
VPQIFDFFKEFYSKEDYTLIKNEYVQYKGRKGDYATLSLWEEIDDYDTFWTIISDFSPRLANLAKRLNFTPLNSVLSERAFSALKLQHSQLRNSLSLAKLSFLYFLYINRRVLDRKIMGYKRNIYDLTPDEEIEEEQEILDHEAKNEVKGIILKEEGVEASTTSQRDGNTTKRRRLNADGGDEED